MSISGLKAVQISKMVDHILHIPGNYRGGNLEMTVVVFHSRLDASLQEDIKAVVDALKRGNELFRNVRLNFVTLKKDGTFQNDVIPLVFLQTGKAYEHLREESGFCPPVDTLFSYLKLFHARSKVVLVFAPEGYKPGDKEKVKEALSPFLKQKLLLFAGDNILTGNQIFMDTLR